MKAILLPILVFGNSIFSEIIKLEQSEIKAVKPKPESMTFVSRSRLDEYAKEYEFEAYKLIKDEINSDLFVFEKNIH